MPIVKELGINSFLGHFDVSKTKKNCFLNRKSGFKTHRRAHAAVSRIITQRVNLLQQ